MNYPGNENRVLYGNLYENQKGTQNTGETLAGTLQGQSSVQTVTYTGEDGSRKKGKTSYWGQARQGYRDAYQAQRDANERARQAAERRAREATAAQIDALNRGYQGTNRQLYQDYMQQQRTLPQQMAAQGYTGGLTESSRLRLGNAYEEALYGNEQARLGQEAEYNDALNQRLYEAQATADAANAEARQRYYDQVAALREQRQQQQREDLERRAATMAAAGDFSLYRQLGYSDAQIRRLRREWERNRKKERKGSSRGGGGRGSSRGGSKKDDNKPGVNQGATSPEAEARAEENRRRFLQAQQRFLDDQGGYIY